MAAIVAAPTFREPKTVCVDFDKTICDSNYPAFGPLKAGAREALIRFKELGFRIIISSCRSCGWHWEEYYGDIPFVPACDREVHQGMVDYLHEHDIPYDIIDDGTRGKVSANFYIDDKGVRFEDNWPDVVKFIESKEEK